MVYSILLTKIYIKQVEIGEILWLVLNIIIWTYLFNMKI